VFRSYRDNFLVLVVCLALFISSGWSVYNSAPHTAKRRAKAPLKFSLFINAQKQLKNNNIAEAEIEPVQATAQDKIASPVPAPSPTPAPQPSVTAWKGDPQPVPLPPAFQTVPVISRVQTDQPVIFLGIDDGWFKIPQARDWLIQHKLPFTLFLENDAIASDYSYFNDLQDAGLTIQDHTLTHPDMATLDFDQQKNQICAAADTYMNVYGQRPTLFRPPFGSFNDLTLQASAACGMKAVVTWHAKANGGSIQFQDGNTHFLPGDIVLMHFRNEFLADMNAFMDQAAKDNLQIGRLEDWLQ
jgi:peptidoglycan/xylan/chitin deacetylase (PgdA/CDA1 family)